MAAERAQPAPEAEQVSGPVERVPDHAGRVAQRLRQDVTDVPDAADPVVDALSRDVVDAMLEDAEAALGVVVVGRRRRDVLAEPGPAEPRGEHDADRDDDDPRQRHRERRVAAGQECGAGERGGRSEDAELQRVHGEDADDGVVPPRARPPQRPEVDRRAGDRAEDVCAEAGRDDARDEAVAQGRAAVDPSEVAVGQDVAGVRQHLAGDAHGHPAPVGVADRVGEARVARHLADEQHREHPERPRDGERPDRAPPGRESPPPAHPPRA